MKRGMPILLAVWLWCGMALGQGVLGDILAGKLIGPKEGVWAWYDLKDASTNQSLMLRLAIVGEEKVGQKNGYWLEVELVPLIGFRSVFKMLLTGPANDPANIHKMMRREGTQPVEEVPLKDIKDSLSGESKPPEPERTLIGQEEVRLDSGPISAEHYTLAQGDRKFDVWLNDKVKPMGLVRLKSDQGDLILKNYGTSGREARSVIHDPVVPGVDEKELGVKVDVKVGEDGKKGKTGDGKP